MADRLKLQHGSPAEALPIGAVGTSQTGSTGSQDNADRIFKTVKYLTIAAGTAAAVATLGASGLLAAPAIFLVDKILEAKHRGDFNPNLHPPVEARKDSNLDAADRHEKMGKIARIGTIVSLFFGAAPLALLMEMAKSGLDSKAESLRRSAQQGKFKRAGAGTNDPQADTTSTAPIVLSGLPPPQPGSNERPPPLPSRNGPHL
ncbi:MAG: hypothetical protein KGQ41_07365 [Alphaproteobacteria bacterium]|nr:hypothetical protein [Alphaproteobacteria bacterium]